jgi:hypothetical protein
MNNILALQSLDISFTDDGPLSETTCPRTGSQYSIGCSTSSNACDVAGMGEHFF